MLNDSTTFLGLDLGDKYSHLAILDPHGDLIEETRIPTSKASFQRKFSGLPPARVAMEVGTHSRWASHLLEELGHEVLVANARPKTPGTSGQAQSYLQQPPQGRPRRRRNPRPISAYRSCAALAHPPPLSQSSS